MNKKKIWLALLVALPILASGFAGMPDAVRVWDEAMETVQYYTYFDLLPQGAIRTATPTAATLTCAAGVMAIFYAATKKGYALTGILVASFLGALAAVLPIVFPQELMVMPNVAVPILLGAECIFALDMKKRHDPAEEKQVRAPRLR